MPVLFNSAFLHPCCIFDRSKMEHQCGLNCVKLLVFSALIIISGFKESSAQLNVKAVNPMVNIGVTFLGEVTEDTDRTKDEYWTYLDREDG